MKQTGLPMEAGLFVYILYILIYAICLAFLESHLK